MRVLAIVVIYFGCWAVTRCAAESTAVYLCNKDIPRAASSQGARAVYRIRPDERKLEVFYSRQPLDIGDAIASPGGKYVAVMCSESSFYYYVLDIVDASGRCVASIEDVRSVPTWNERGTCIAYTTSYMTQTGERHSSGTWMRDMETGRAVKLCEEGGDLHWARFDGRVYIRPLGDEGRVLAYDPKTSSLSRAPYSDIIFSPDYRYYMRQDEDSFQLFLRKTGEEITDRYKFLRSDIAIGCRWLSPGLIVSEYALCDYVLELETGRAVRTSGKVLCLLAKEEALLVSRNSDGRVETVLLADLPSVPAEGKP